MKTVMMAFSAFVMVLAAAIYMLAGAFDQKTMNDLGPALFPRMVAIALFSFGLVEIYISYRSRQTTYRIADVFDKNIRFPLVGIAVSALYILGLMYLGYIVATTLFVGVMLWFLGMRQPIRLLVIAICTSTVIYWLFEKFLVVPLPRGEFF